jgi:hypothetical protein
MGAAKPARQKQLWPRADGLTRYERESRREAGAVGSLATHNFLGNRLFVNIGLDDLVVQAIQGQFETV